MSKDRGRIATATAATAAVAMMPFLVLGKREKKPILYWWHMTYLSVQSVIIKLTRYHKFSEGSAQFAIGNLIVLNLEYDYSVTVPPK